MIESLLASLRSLTYRNDDDNTDRAHYFITSNLLIGMSILVSFKQFGGKPIECMTPPKFPGAWEDYAENYCWAQDTYMAPFDSRIPVDQQDRDRTKISYYQWVPFFLIFQAACFRLPSMIYKFLIAKAGLTVHDLVEIAINPNNIAPETRKESIRSLTTYLQGALRFHRRLDKKQVTPYKIPCANLPFSSFYVTFIYLVCKLMYFCNAWLQFVVLNKFMETDKEVWHGWPSFRGLIYGQQWEQTSVFPRVTICDFQVRGDPANVQRYSVQCVMVINIFNEKIFIFLWFWYVCLLAITIISALEWLWLMLLPCSSTSFVSRHLEMSDMVFDPVASRSDVKRFVDKYIHSDGIFVLRMITSHAGAIFGTELVLSLYREFYHLDQYIRVSASDTPMTPAEKLSRIHQEAEEENSFNCLKIRRNKQHSPTVMKGNGIDIEAGQRLITREEVKERMMAYLNMKDEENEEKKPLTDVPNHRAMSTPTAPNLQISPISNDSTSSPSRKVTSPASLMDMPDSDAATARMNMLPVRRVKVTDA